MTASTAPRPRPTDARRALQDCIQHCAKSRDERGRWRAQRTCLAALDLAHPDGGSANTAAACAARRIGAWLAGAGA